MRVPRLTEDLRRLEWPHRCQRCGAADGLITHQEHDDDDRPEMRYVVLCGKCSGRFVEKHPRLYRALSRHEPAPGVMRICAHCEHGRDGRCLSPLARANGGPGLKLPGPDLTAFVDGTRGGRRCGWVMRTWSRETTECPGFAPREPRGCELRGD